MRRYHQNGRDYRAESEVERLTNDLIYIERMIAYGSSVFDVIDRLNQSHIDRSESTFEYAVARPVDLMGEQLASDKLSYTTRNEYDVDWSLIRSTRNQICRSYEDVDFKKIFNFIESDLSDIIDQLIDVKTDIQRRLNQTEA